MSEYKTPGIYLVEKNAFPNSVVEVATAIPVFIGYTEMAEYKGQSVLNKPYRITSFAEFSTIFGGAPKIKFTLDDSGKSLTDSILGDSANLAKRFRLYNSMRMFFQNGGSTCYILSVGNYEDTIEEGKLKDAICLLEKEQEPTLVLVPEAVCLPDASACANVQNEVLSHCKKMENRFAILDIYDGFEEFSAKENEKTVATFRKKINNYLNYGAAYYPWLNASVVTADDVTFQAIENIGKLKELIDASTTSTEVKALTSDMLTCNDKNQATVIHKALKAAVPKYTEILELVRKELNLMPPSAAMAGIYTAVDNTVGVWKAPANVGINGVVTPAINLTDNDQEDLNVPTNGKSVNAIRSFIGSGIKVWGARTLDGNSQEWRYVNVRRTLIMIEESLRQASKAYVFEPNTLNTWVTMKSMFNNFLTNVWKRGGLAGASPEDAFEVYVGLNETMTADDILEGILRITVKVALSRPAEFIEITFQQQQQKS